MLKRLVREEVGHQILNDQFEFFLDLVSFLFCLLFKDAKIFSCQGVLFHGIYLWSSIETFYFDDI